MNKGGITMAKPSLMKGLLFVKKKAYLSPHYIRITLEGPDIYKFSKAKVGDNNKILIPASKVEEQVFEDALQVGLKGNNVPFTVRTYTLRRLDLDKGEMDVDFIMHGESGPASKWAIHANVGDSIGVLMKEKSKPVYQPADWYLLVGDHTAVPVISVILESISPHAKGIVILEVHGPEDILELQKPEDVQITWVFNPEPGKETSLPAHFNKVEIELASDKFIFVAAEHKAVSQIQHTLRNTASIDRKDWYAYAYWKYGEAEDASKAERAGNRR